MKSFSDPVIMTRLVLGTLSVVAAMPAAAQVQPSTFKTRDESVRRPELSAPGLTLTTGLSATYDDNIFRVDENRRPVTDDLIVTPSLIAEYQKQIGVNDFTLNADVSYGYYTQNPDRSRIRAIGQARGNVRIAGQCVLRPLALVQRQRADYGDINGPIDNFQTFTALGLEATCPRTVGLFPIVAYRRDTSDNDPEFAFANQRANSYTVGMGYARPSIGTLTAYFNRVDSARDAIGVTNHIDRAGLTFVRAVVSSVSLKADVQYLSARSVGAVVRPYRGLGWAGEFLYRPLPRLSLTLTTDRRIINDTLVPAGFAVQTDVGLRSEWQFAERTRVHVQGSYAERMFRGDPLVVVSGINFDHVTDVEAGITRRIGARVDLRGQVRHISRQTDTDASQFRVTLATGGISYRF